MVSMMSEFQNFDHTRISSDRELLDVKVDYEMVN